MHGSSQVNTGLSDFHWLAFLLTDNHESSIEIAAETAASVDDSNGYFSTWMVSWSRRLVIARALALVRDELAASARRTESARPRVLSSVPPNWELDPGTSKAQLQNALLAIDLFPRAALLLSTFEGIAVNDAAVLLDVYPDLVKKGRAIASRELTANLATSETAGRRRDSNICRISGSKPAKTSGCLAHFITSEL